MTGETVAALYGRVSTKRQSCLAQMNEIRQWCERQGWPIFKEYEDWGFSGRRADRPALNQLLEDAKAGRFKVLVVYRLDRFGRNLSNVIHNILELDAMNVRLVSVSEGIDTNDKSPMGRFLVHVLAALAQFEVNVLQERINDGIEHAREHGTRSGKTIGGQRKVFRRDVVLDLKRQGLSYRQIARQMKLGVGTVFRVCSTTVQGNHADI